jgi:hypothetical protein
LDDFSYRLNPKDHQTSLLNMPYPSNNIEKAILFSNYFIRMPKKYTEKEVTEKLEYDITNSGRPICRECDNRIEQEPLKHLNDSKFNVATHSENKDVYVPEAISSVRELVKICKKNNIKLRIFINPLHKTTYLANNLEIFNKFKKELAQITDYYDFSGLNKITTNNLMYYETSHYRVKVGDMIIAKIYNSKDKNSDCSTFGAYVTTSNIDGHLNCFINDLKKH